MIDRYTIEGGATSMHIDTVESGSCEPQPDPARIGREYSLQEEAQMQG